MIRKALKVIAFSLVSTVAFGAGGSQPLDSVQIDLENTVSLQRGAALFTNYCMGCHSTKYARYERVANDLGIPNDLYEKNLIFSGAKIGELMTIAMKPEEGKAFFGATPPDLTLEARLRGTDWLYSYLRGFYKDDSRPYGVNNVVFKDVGMPHVLEGLQGLCAHPPHIGAEKQFDPLTGKLIGDVCSEYVHKGSLTPEEYDQAVTDLVGFLAYMGDPNKLESHRIGTYVLLFIVFLSVFVFLLNREYWKDIH